MLGAWLKIGVIGTTPNSDYTSYIQTAAVLTGHAGTLYPQRILKPLAPFGVGLLAPTFGDRGAFLLEVLLCYVGMLVVVYLLAEQFFGEVEYAVCYALLVGLSYPVLKYGIDLYTETGALFFYIWSLLLSLRFMRRPVWSLVLANTVVIALGLLWKEYSVVAAAVFGLLIFLHPDIARHSKARYLAVLVAGVLCVDVLWQWYVFVHYHYTYLSWWHAGGATGFATQLTVHNIAKSVFALLLLAWPFAAVGAWRARLLEHWQRVFIVMSLVPALVVFAWGYVSSRLFFVLAIPLYLLAVVGLSYLPHRWMRVACLVGVIATTIVWLFLSYRIVV